jgi:hypothetical protein
MTCKKFGTLVLLNTTSFRQFQIAQTKAQTHKSLSLSQSRFSSLVTLLDYFLLHACNFRSMTCSPSDTNPRLPSGPSSCHDVPISSFIAGSCSQKISYRSLRTFYVGRISLAILSRMGQWSEHGLTKCTKDEAE